MYSQFLRQLDESITPQHLMMEEILSWSRRSVKIPAELEIEWARQVIWGVLSEQYFRKIGKIQRKNAFVNLLRGNRFIQIAETNYPVNKLDVDQLLIEPDLTPIRQAQDEGHGVLVIGYHLGPPYRPGRILGKMGCNVLTFSRARLTRYYDMPDNWKNIVLKGASSKYALWEARDYLKKNYIVSFAGDGRVGADPVLYDLYGDKVAVNMGFAFLAEHTKAKVFFCNHEWTKDFRFKLIFHPAKPYIPDEYKKDYPVESRWVFSYLDHFRQLITNQPRLITLTGGFWQHDEGGIKWCNPEST